MTDMFDDYNDKNFEEPEEREAAELKRSDKKIGKVKKRSSSVKLETFIWSQFAINVIMVLLVIAVISAAIWLGVNLFING